MGVRPATGRSFTLSFIPRSEGFSRSDGTERVFNLPLTFGLRAFPARPETERVFTFYPAGHRISLLASYQTARGIQLFELFG